MSSASGQLLLHALLLCDYALTAQDGKLSVMGIFSQINVPRLPAVHGRCFVVSILEATPGEHLVYTHFSPLAGKPDLPENYHTVSIRLVDEAGATRVQLSQDGNADDDARRHSEEEPALLFPEDACLGSIEHSEQEQKRCHRLESQSQLRGCQPGPLNGPACLEETAWVLALDADETDGAGALQ